MDEFYASRNRKNRRKTDFRKEIDSMKNKEGLNVLKKEVGTMNRKLTELTEDELELVSGASGTGIGSGRESGGKIVIRSGTVTAGGSGNAPSIGGGYADTMNIIGSRSARMNPSFELPVGHKRGAGISE